MWQICNTEPDIPVSKLCVGKRLVWHAHHSCFRCCTIDAYFYHWRLSSGPPCPHIKLWWHHFPHRDFMLPCASPKTAIMFQSHYSAFCSIRFPLLRIFVVPDYYYYWHIHVYLSLFNVQRTEVLKVFDPWTLPASRQRLDQCNLALITVLSLLIIIVNSEPPPPHIHTHTHTHTKLSQMLRNNRTSPPGMAKKGSRSDGLPTHRFKQEVTGT